MEHEVAAVKELRNMVEGTGGGLMVLHGQTSPYYAGLRRAPAATLFEAVLTFTLDEDGYHNIVAFTGAGSHLPQIQIDERITAGLNVCAWLVKGDADDASSQSQPSPSQGPSHAGLIDMNDVLQKHGIAGLNRVLFMAQDMEWAERLELFLKEVERRAGVVWKDSGHVKAEENAELPRCLAIVDGCWLCPQSLEEINLPVHRRTTLGVRFSSFARIIKQSPLDLLILATDPNYGAALTSGGFIEYALHTELNARFGHIPSDEQRDAHVRTALREAPVLRWDSLKNIEMARVQPDMPWGQWLRKSQDLADMYLALRKVSPMVPGKINKVIKIVDGFQIEYSDVLLEHVAGYDDVKESVRSVLEIWSNPEMAKQYGLTGAFGLFLYGPGGTGKTMMAKAIAGELDLPYIYVQVSEIMDKYVGESSKKMAQLFAALRTKEKVVVIFDELDALLGTSEGSNESEAKEQVRTTFKQELAVRDPNHRLFTIGTTNSPWLISSAEMRRIGEPRYVGLPNEIARRRLFELFLRDKIKRPVAADVDFQVLSQKTEGFSGDDIQKICESAAQKAFNESKQHGKMVDITMRHLQQAINGKTPTIGQEELDRFLAYQQSLTGRP